MKEEDFNFPRGILWKCQRCAKCCRDAPERERRILILSFEAKQIGKMVGFPLERFCRKTGLKPFTLEMKKDSEGKCLFLKENGCQIYSIRPLVCRFYPFWLEKRKDEAFSFKITDECVGIGFGQILEEDFFKHLFDVATDRIKSR